MAGQSQDAAGFPIPGMDQLVEMQERGLRAMRQVVDSWAGGSPPSGDGVSMTTGAAEDDAGPASAMDLVNLFTDMWKDMVRSTLVLVMPGSAGPARPAASEAVRVEAGNDDGEASRASGQLLITNRTDDAFRDLTLRSGPLESPSGATIPGAAVSFEPSTIDYLAPQLSRTVQVLVDVPAVPEGTYRGIVQVVEVDGLWSPVEVVVGDVLPI